MKDCRKSQKMGTKALDHLLRNMWYKSFLLHPYEICSKDGSLLLWCRVSLSRAILPPGALETCGLGFTCHNDRWGLGAWSLLTWWPGPRHLVRCLLRKASCTPTGNTALVWVDCYGELKGVQNFVSGLKLDKTKAHRSRGQRNSWYLGRTCIEDFDDAYNHHLMRLSYLSSLQL